MRNAFEILGFQCRDGYLAGRDVGAPSLRERWFLLAYSDSKRLSLSGRDEESTQMENRDESFLFLQKKLWSQSARDRARVDDGIPPRTHRIRIVGKAVVPLQAREAFKRLMGIK